eukprot:g515.t1
MHDSEAYINTDLNLIALQQASSERFNFKLFVQDRLAHYIPGAARRPTVSNTERSGSSDDKREKCQSDDVTSSQEIIIGKILQWEIKLCDSEVLIPTGAGKLNDTMGRPGLGPGLKLFICEVVDCSSRCIQACWASTSTLKC